MILSVLCAANGISLATIGFPHIEIAIPALILLILACWTRGYRRLAWMLVPLLLMIREDAGLHLAIIVALFAIWRWRARRTSWLALGAVGAGCVLVRSRRADELLWFPADDRTVLANDRGAL